MLIHWPTNSSITISEGSLFLWLDIIFLQHHQPTKNKMAVTNKKEINPNTLKNKTPKISEIMLAKVPGKKGKYPE